MSIRHIARLAMVTVGLLGVTAALAGCGAEAVKEPISPPISQNDATKDRIKSIQESSSGGKSSPGVEKAPDHTAPKTEGDGK